LEAQSIDRVVLVTSNLNDAASLEILRHCQEHAVKVSVLPSLVEGMGPNMQVDHIGGMTVLAVNPPLLPRSSRALKRAIDLVVSSLALVLLAPVLAVMAIAIKLDSSGPVFFRQERVGRGDRRFKLLKFRSMVSDAEDLRAGLMELSKDPDWLHLEHDPRITAV